MDSELPLQAKIDLWRQKSLQGTLTDDELREAVNTIRAGRVAAAQLGATRKSTRGPARSAEDMLAGFLGDDNADDSAA